MSNFLCNKLNTTSAYHILAITFNMNPQDTECYISDCPYHDSQRFPNADSGPFGWCDSGMCGVQNIEDW